MLLTFAADVGDADSTRTIWAIIALLVVMGLALVMLAFWVRRTTRPDPEFLAPLEMMDDRSWRKGDAVWQRRRLDEVRPHSAKPLERSAAPPIIDESFDAGPSGSGFDDLHGDATHDESPPVAGADALADGDAHDGTRQDAMDREGVDRERAAGVAGEGEGAEGDGTDVAATPVESARPPLDQLPDGEFDQSALQRALDELDAELEADRGDR